MEEVPDSKSGRAHLAYNEETAKSVLMYDLEQQRQLTLLFVVLSYLFMRSTDATQQRNTNEGIYCLC